MSLVIAQPSVLSVVLEVEGTASLIQNSWGQKAVEEMLRKHMGLSVQREKKKPREVIEQATVRNVEGTVCVSPVAFKCAMVSASAGLKSFERKKTLLQTSLLVEGASVPITYERQVPRMDMVRLAGIGRTPDVRFRPQFDGWKARFAVIFSDNLLNVQSVVDLVQRAGRVGIGEWRPERRGTYGTFTISRVVDSPVEVEEVRAACAIPLRTPVIPDWALDANIDPEVIAKAMAGCEEAPGIDVSPD